MNIRVHGDFLVSTYTNGMAKKLYIERKAIFEDRQIHESELLDLSNFLVVLAEPGAGKTELLDSLANKLGVKRQRASVFRHDMPSIQQDILVIDGLDEVAKIDTSAIDALIALIAKKGPRRVVLASRSSEWDALRYTGLIHDFIGEEPKTVRLLPFDEDEQKSLFDSHFPDEDFKEFQEQAVTFELGSLLGNPQFLILFANAYIQNDRAFETKKKIFKDAIRSLAEEKNANTPKGNRPSTDTLIQSSEEIFCQLLLSGSAGFVSEEEQASAAYPYLRSIQSSDSEGLKYVLDTGLFRPAENLSEHEPVHRIVAEYCAANYLANRIADKKDTLTLSRCLSLIAPNATVRVELRGLLGWLATMGDKETQEKAIDLNPYAVLANGDPSQLLVSSKRRLLKNLKTLASTDPYFRSSDRWRAFSVRGFFSEDVLDETRKLLRKRDDSSHLYDLLLELLYASDASKHLKADLENIALDHDRNQNTRQLALRNLLVLPNYDHTLIFTALIGLATPDTIKLAAYMAEELGVQCVGRDRVLTLLNRLADQYPENPNERVRKLGSRYYISRLIRSFELSDSEWFLDQLGHSLSCVCGEEMPHRCKCRNGTSKIIGHLMDQYFKLAKGPFDPKQILMWTKELNFHHHCSAEASRAVAVLQNSCELRQAIQLLIFADETDQEEIWKKRNLFHGHSHAGLLLQTLDYRHIVDYAFKNNKPDLWSGFFTGHNRYQETKGPNDLRTRMRQHANKKSEFMKVWKMRERESAASWRENRMPRYRGSRRWEKTQAKIQEENRAHLQANRNRIESGEHWGWLNLFSTNYLMDPQKNLNHVDDPLLPETSLQNCIPFLQRNSLPTLNELAELQCRQKHSIVIQVLYAACVAIFRTEKTLDRVPVEVLEVVKTDADIGYPAVEEVEREAIESEINRLAFSDINDVERFARAYLEPQLAVDGDHHTRVDWLRYKPEFESISGKLALDWLNRFPSMSFSAMDTLFEISTKRSKRADLDGLIERRCYEFSTSKSYGPLTQQQKQKKDFWLLRSLFFVANGDYSIWQHFSTDKKSIFMFESVYGNRGFDSRDGWPDLTAENMYKLLEMYIEDWPKVHLPDSWGSDDPDSERAFRFLTDTVWRLGKENPDAGIPVLERLISQKRFEVFHDIARHLKSESTQKNALRDFRAPALREIAAFLDQNRVASVEDLRAFLLEELDRLQTWIQQNETDPLKTFYENDRHVDENTARDRIVDYLQPRLNPLNILIPIERHLARSKRCDFTAETSIDGNQNMLTVEVKGQWHKDLYSAASEQLHIRYAHHPNAALQGIFLVLWFGAKMDIASRKKHGIKSASELRENILKMLPDELHGRIDVFVLDLERKVS